MAEKNKVLYMVAVLTLLVLAAGCLSTADLEQNPQQPTSTSSQNPETTESNDVDQYTHEFNESFVVGSGDDVIRYRLVAQATLDTVGSNYAVSEADGVFIAVALEMENQGSQTYDISSNHIKLMDEQGREFSASTEAMTYASQDPRISTETITFDQLQPGLEVRRAVIFDVPTGQGYALKIEPTGVFSSDNPHYIPLGTVNESA